MCRILNGNPIGVVRRLGAFPTCSSGTALMEFAFVAPILILLTIGSFDLGRAVWLDVTLQHAAKEAARFASLRGAESLSPASESDVEDFVRGRTVGIAPPDLGITVSWFPNNSSGSTVQINLIYQYDFLMRGMLPIGPIQLEGSASRVVL